MTFSIYHNIADCAERRMDLLWKEACEAKGNAWLPILDRKWREHETAISMRRLAFAAWQRL